MKQIREQEAEKAQELMDTTGVVPPALGVAQEGNQLAVTGLPGPPPAPVAATNGAGPKPSA
jgi:hypothetical protein